MDNSDVQTLISLFFLSMQGYMFCYGDIATGLMFLRNAYIINHQAGRQLGDWCEVAYAFAIASIASGNVSDVETGLTELAYIHLSAAYSPFCLEDIRRETLRRLAPSEMVVLRELPSITCRCLVGPCQFIDDVLGCQGINASIPEAEQCCMECVATVEYMKFRSELYIHCL